LYVHLKTSVNTDPPFSHSVDDSFLQKAASSLPKFSILPIEDIDCAFPPRSGEDDDEQSTTFGLDGFGMLMPSYPGTRRRSSVTLSGLLNVLDGIRSEEGNLFFATVGSVPPIF
jgi:mitochondrial chaperone BCS1